MGIIDKVCGKIGLMDTEEELSEREDEITKENRDMNEKEFMSRQERPENRMAPPNVVDFQNAASAREGSVSNVKLKVIVIEPKSFDDAQEVANCLREKRPVVINFDKTDAEAAKRIIDFISGTTYALNGEIKKVGRNVFLCAPNNVNVSYTEDDTKKSSAEMPWMKR